MYDFKNYENFIANRIYQLRNQKNVTAREMSLAIGQHKGYITQIENRQNLPSIQEMCIRDRHSDSTESIIVIREFVQHQSPINRKIILYRYLGYSNAEIGNRFHLSRQSINRHIQKIKVDFINWQKQN